MNTDLQVTWQQTYPRRHFPWSLFVWLFAWHHSDDCWNAKAGYHTAGYGRRWWRYEWAVRNQMQRSARPVAKGSEAFVSWARGACERELRRRVNAREEAEAAEAAKAIAQLWREADDNRFQ